MSAISATSAGAAPTTDSSASAAPRKELGKDDFLRLLITQLQNQDPLSPVDNSQMIAQLAQFSSLEQMQGVTSRLDTLLVAQTSANNLGTASMVGRDVAYRTDVVDWTAGGPPAALAARLDAAAEVSVVIQDASGRTVRTLQLGVRPAGEVQFTWDGLDARGNPLPSGTYRLNLGAKTGAGEDVGATLRARGRVRGVTFDGEVPLLLIGSSRVKLSDVVEITQA